jgi:diguanylate cyclase (GGDEF)-like protein
VQVNLGVALASIFLLSPFALNNFIHGRIFLGVGATVIVAIGVFTAGSILKGRAALWVASVLLVPAILAFLALCFWRQGIIATFWCYPSVLAFYFMLTPKQGRIANFLLMAITIPEAWLVVPAPLAIRFTITLLAVSIFTAIFVSNLARQQKLLQKMAVTDQLTGVFNRTVLDKSLERAVQQSLRTDTPMTLIALDLDLFKSINDSFGHEAGDTVLRAVGTTLNQRFRGSDQVFRLGGEEFLAVLYDTDTSQGNGVADELRRIIAALDLLPGRQVTVSLGVAGLKPGESWKDWLKRSDRRLYRAKSAGRNRVVAEVA